MDIVHKLQQSAGTNTGTGTSTGSGTGVGAQDVDYFLTADGLVSFRDGIYVPENSELKNMILREFHVKPYLGRSGYQKTLIAVKRFYYWPNLKRDVVEFVAKHFDCQCVKVECKHPSALLQLIVIPEWKWEVISIEFITGFLRIVRQHDSIMVVVDRLAKISHFIHMKFAFLANDVAQVFIRDLVMLHDVLKKLCQTGMQSSLPSFRSCFW